MTMRKRKLPGRHLFVLDTNVLMHDPSAIFRFQEHDIFVPMVVLEELDAAKKGLSEVARNARHVSRLLDDLIGEAGQESIQAGLPLPGGGSNGNPGRVFFQTEDVSHALPASLRGGSPDNSILSVAIALRQDHPDASTVLVSKDINLRIKARVLGIRAEDYFDDMVLDDASLLYNGMTELPRSLLDLLASEPEQRRRDGRTYFEVDEAQARQWDPNQCLYAPDPEKFDVIFRDLGERGAALEPARDFTEKATPCGEYTHETVSRILPSTCSWIRTWTLFLYSEPPAPARLYSRSPPVSRRPSRTRDFERSS